MQQEARVESLVEQGAFAMDVEGEDGAAGGGGGGGGGGEGVFCTIEGRIDRNAEARRGQQQAPLQQRAVVAAAERIRAAAAADW